MRHRQKTLWHCPKVTWLIQSVPQNGALLWGTPFTPNLCPAIQLRPVCSIQRSILNGFGNVLAFDLGIAFHVGDGARDLQNTVMRASAQALLLHGALQHALAVTSQVAVRPNLARTHLRVRVVALAGRGKAVELDL